MYRILINVLFLTFLASLTSLLFANNYKNDALPCPPILTLNEGAYLGIDLGYDSYRVARDVDITDTVSIDPRISVTGMTAGGFLGYGKYLHEFYDAYLGLELFGNWSNANSSFDSVRTTTTGRTSTDIDFDVKNNFGIDFIPGIKLNHASLFYLRIGYNWAHFNATQTVTSSASPVSTEYDDSTTRGGFHYGLGLEAAIFQNLSIRADYTHTGFSTINKNIDNGFVTGTISDAVSDNQFLLSLNYHLGF